MANNMVQLKTDVKTAFGANLDAATIQKLRDRFVSAYSGQFAAFLVANSLIDTVANRNTFAVECVFNYMANIYTGESAKANVAAVPAADTFV